MNYFARKKLFCLMLAACLALAVTGAFTFSAAETFRLNERPAKQHAAYLSHSLEKDADNFLASISYSLDCLAGEVFLEDRENKHLPVFARVETPRAIYGINSTGSYQTKLSKEALKDSRIPISKNPLPINLRI